MAKFRKKPVVIEAEQLTPDVAWAHLAEGKPLPFNISLLNSSWNKERGVIHHFRAAIQTLEGTMGAEIGDWIIKGVKGELYPCKPDIFAATYEKVEIVEFPDIDSRAQPHTRGR